LEWEGGGENSTQPAQQSISLSIFSLQPNIGAVAVALAPPPERFGAQGGWAMQRM